LSVPPKVGAETEREVQDAARRTRLANERTYLAWWRTGLTSLAVCVGLGRIVPGVTGVTKWPYEAVGAAYGIVGVAFMVIAHMRMRSVESAVDAGGFAHLDQRLARAMLLVGAALGIATVALVVFAD
jgi:inner membrane protein YidH